jgi:hypothetical protein
MIAVCGIGWINEEGYGCVRKSMQVNRDVQNTSTFPPKKKDMFLYPFDNFGRLDGISKKVCYAVALTLKDAGLDYPFNEKLDIGIASTNTNGCLESDIRYFKDYCDNGRKLGRGNLFIYTLPSSPLSEAAIYFGLEGALFYMAKTKKSLAGLTTMAADMISSDEVSMMFVGKAEEKSAVFLLLANASDFVGDTLCDIKHVKTILEKELIISDTIKELSVL